MRMSIRLPDELSDRIDAHKIRSGATISKIVALALDQYLFIQERAEELHRQASQPLPGDELTRSPRRQLPKRYSDYSRPNTDPHDITEPD